jgi:hypothetical protein
VPPDICMCVCTYIQTDIHTCRHTYIHTYMQTYEAVQASTMSPLKVLPDIDSDKLELMHRNMQEHNDRTIVM